MSSAYMLSSLIDVILSLLSVCSLLWIGGGILARPERGSATAATLLIPQQANNKKGIEVRRHMNTWQHRLDTSVIVLEMG